MRSNRAKWINWSALHQILWILSLIFAWHESDASKHFFIRWKCRYFYAYDSFEISISFDFTWAPINSISTICSGHKKSKFRATGPLWSESKKPATWKAIPFLSDIMLMQHDTPEVCLIKAILLIYNCDIYQHTETRRHASPLPGLMSLKTC